MVNHFSSLYFQFINHPKNRCHPRLITWTICPCSSPHSFCQSHTLCRVALCYYIPSVNVDILMPLFCTNLSECLVFVTRSMLVLIGYINKPPLHAAHWLSRQCSGGPNKMLVLLARYKSLPTDKITLRENKKDRETERRGKPVSVH